MGKIYQNRCASIQEESTNLLIFSKDKSRFYKYTYTNHFIAFQVIHSKMFWQSNAHTIEIADEDDLKNFENQNIKQRQNHESPFQNADIAQDQSYIVVNQNSVMDYPQNNSLQPQPPFNTALAQQLLNQTVNLRQQKQGQTKPPCSQLQMKDGNQPNIDNIPSFEPPHISSRYAFLANKIQVEHPLQIDLTSQTKNMSLQQQDAFLSKQVIPLQHKSDNKDISQSIQLPQLTESEKKHVQQLKDMINKNANLDALKEKIVKLIPQLQGQINCLGQQEINQIYQTISNQITIQQINKEQQQPAKKLSTSVVQGRITMEYSAQLHLNNHPYTTEFTIEKLNKQSQNSDKQSINNIQSALSHQRKTNKNQLDLEAFKQFKALNPSELQTRLIQIFPMNRQSIILMNSSQLLEIVQQIIDQLQKQDKSKNLKNTQQQTNQQLKSYITQNIQNTANKQNEKLDLQGYAERPKNHTEQPNYREINEQTKTLKDRQETTNLKQSNDPISAQSAQKTTEDNTRCQNVIFKETGLNFRETLEIVVANFPELKQTLQKMSQEDIKSIYDQVMSSGHKLDQSNKLKPKDQSLEQKGNRPTLKQHKSIQDNQINNHVTLSNQQSKPNDNIKRSLKRTHSNMMAESLPIQSSDELKDIIGAVPRKKPKINISDLRARLIKRLPQLKNNIMNLDDKQIQKIFMETLDQKDKTQPKQIKNFQQIRPVILLESRPLPFSQLNNHKQQVTRKQLFKNKNDKESTELVQVIQKGKKRSRTLILVHSEDEDQKTICQKEVNQVCRCKCCQKNNNNIPPIFQRIMKSMLNC